MGHMLAGSLFLQEDADLMWKGSNLGTLIAGGMNRQSILLKLLQGATCVAKRVLLPGPERSLSVSSPAPGMLGQGPFSMYESHAGYLATHMCCLQLTGVPLDGAICF